MPSGRTPPPRPLDVIITSCLRVRSFRGLRLQRHEVIEPDLTRPERDPKIKKNGDEVDYSLKVPLVVVEDKGSSPSGFYIRRMEWESLTNADETAPGIVRGEDWDPYPKHPHASEHNWMSRLMPQLFM